MAREDPKFMLRLPGDMRDRITEAAKANNRSMNAEIVARLDRSFLTKSPGQSMGSALRKLSRIDPVALQALFQVASETDPAEFDHALDDLATTPASPPAPTSRSVGPEDESRGGHEAPGGPGPTVPGTGRRRS
ncbi:Arc family DNA-binding protein [Roseomonas sp. CAU 1739]|uniref:Arc family DNA-binding protein n=1 Tax=Roseomonas sp. CAU 1739 TaxID=3140364 RepID=UPI0038D1A71C